MCDDREIIIRRKSFNKSASDATVQAANITPKKPGPMSPELRDLVDKTIERLNAQLPKP